MKGEPNNFLQATAVCALLLVLDQIPAAPEDNCWAAQTFPS
jgi:hypothetical protein